MMGCGIDLEHAEDTFPMGYCSAYIRVSLLTKMIPSKSHKSVANFKTLISLRNCIPYAFVLCADSSQVTLRRHCFTYRTNIQICDALEITDGLFRPFIEFIFAANLFSFSPMHILWELLRSLILHFENYSCWIGLLVQNEPSSSLIKKRLCMQWSFCVTFCQEDALVLDTCLIVMMTMAAMVHV